MIYLIHTEEEEEDKDKEKEKEKDEEEEGKGEGNGTYMRFNTDTVYGLVNQSINLRKHKN